MALFQSQNISADDVNDVSGAVISGDTSFIAYPWFRHTWHMMNVVVVDGSGRIEE
jgi:hypothetical protein